jgi:hypothetical protein
VQRTGWQEWAKIDPQAAVAAWQNLQTQGITVKSIKVLAETISKGLIHAPADKTTEAVKNLTPEQQAMLLTADGKVVGK